MKYFNAILVLIPILLIFSTCKKTPETSSPVITVITPTENEHFDLPATVAVKLNVVSDEALIVVSLRIESEDQVPLSVTVFLYPDADEFDFDTDLQIDYFDVEANENTYLHVKAENSAGVSHDFVKLDFSMPDIVFKGFYLLSRPTVSQTKVKFYDMTFVSANYLTLPYEFTDVEVLSIDEILLILTKSPDQLQAFYFPNTEAAWGVKADLPVPEMYRLNLSDGIIYTSTGNGQVLGYRADNGQQQFISHLVFDSVPGQIGVTADYVVADYQSLIGPERAWMVFYRTTAGLVHQYASQLVVHDFYPALSKNNLLAFGNIGQLGVIQFYDVEQNNNLISLNFETGTIGASCMLEEGFFLVAVGNEIWKFDESQQNATLLRQTDEDVIDLQYDKVAQQIYVAYEYSLDIYNASADTIIKGFESSSPIKAVRLQYGYPDE